MAKSEAATAARRVGRVSVAALSTLRTMDPNLKAGLSRPSSRPKSLPSGSLRRRELQEPGGPQRVQRGGAQAEVGQRVEPVADDQRALDRRGRAPAAVRNPPELAQRVAGRRVHGHRAGEAGPLLAE